ncbi:acyl-CoA N-acyltransferase [Hypoxylon trugodes]|uniref:acyl-CoA N-acyltransferase n=1 Tax=Hypoxylon trugodes TaxID=326681 RepID=UPI0021958B61|nr:acyl-CoA N-acyltransferase [Hypoxylon trugodes]KAI1389380.1 acyl-CoA N-acyltransferase [Hypoxylon trugodes]
MTLPFAIPPSLSPSFTISRCTAADVDELGEIYYDSFKTDKRNTFWWPVEKEPMVAWMHRRNSRKIGDSSMRHFKVTDVQSGEIAAFARWDIPEGYEAAFGEWPGENVSAVDVSVLVQADESAGDAQQKPGEDVPVTTAPVDTITPPAVADYPEGADPEPCRVFFDALKKVSEKHNADAMLGLSLLCTSPKYQKKGAAKALMLPMLAIADAHGLKTYLEATPNGKPVYERIGFREVDQLTFDIEKLTGKPEGIYYLSIMVREPKSQ